MLDESCLDRILTNLIGNALKFTESGSVTVEVNNNHERIELQVRDTGIGISSEFVPYLFDEFKQESTGLSRTYEGSGLGLAITKKLVNAMNGSISVSSQKDQGSTFTISFPKLIDTIVEEQASTRTNDGNHLPVEPIRHKILVVEDNPDTLSLLEHVFSKYYDVYQAANESMAMKIAREHPVDVILMDINLGTIRSGVDVLADLRQVPGFQSVPALALTAYVLPGDRARFLRKGFDEYLGKPFSTKDLLRLVDKLIRERVDK